MSTSLIGGWTGFDFEMFPEALDVFETALHGHVGVKYVPHALATQVVQGTNYCFLCGAIGVYPEAKPYAAKVYIYKPLKGAPHISRIIEDTP